MTFYHYVIVFLLVVLLPLLSFFRSSAVLRGGGKQPLRRQRSTASATDAATPDGARAAQGRRAGQARRNNGVLSSPAWPWDPAALAYDDATRVRFLCSIAAPLLAMSYWLLSWIESKVLQRSAASDPSTAAHAPVILSCMAALPVSLATMLTGAQVALLLLYLYFVYLDHRDKDVSIRRHNTSIWNRMVNWYKFSASRPLCNWLYRKMQQYFDLQLVSGYGPLPLYRDDDEEDRAAAMAATNGERIKASPRNGDAGSLDGSGTASNGGGASGAGTAGSSSRRSNSSAAARESSRATGAPPRSRRRLSYFFAAHPHGILPLCACTNMLGNAAVRNRILFYDNSDVTDGSPAAPPVAAEATAEKGIVSNGSAATETSSSVPLASQEEKLQPRGGATAPATPAYAAARYYDYDAATKSFVLRPSASLPSAPTATARDEVTRTGAVPSSASSTTNVALARIHTVVATFPFYLPIMRELYMAAGFIDASYETCKRVLWYSNSTRQQRHHRYDATGASVSSIGRGGGKAAGGTGAELDGAEGEGLPPESHHLLLYPGGASEAFLSSSTGPQRVLLRRRKGFLRLAIHTQSGLVPVYTFGETDYYSQLSTVTKETLSTAGYDDDDTVSKGRVLQEEAATTDAPPGDRPSLQEELKRVETCPSGQLQSPNSAGSVIAQQQQQQLSWTQKIQRLFQETFGLSLPVVKNVVPRRVKVATVVGRPIFFELSDDLRRMYTDPKRYYDRDAERAILLAAQEVYIQELTDLFMAYAPQYIADPERRRLEVF